MEDVGELLETVTLSSKTSTISHVLHTLKHKMLYNKHIEDDVMERRERWLKKERGQSTQKEPHYDHSPT